MPWLVKNPKENTEDDLLLVHVPRCGGTSLVKEFRVLSKARSRVNWYHKIGLTYFFYRYRLLESGNFPVWTWENLYAVVSLAVGFIVWAALPDWESEICSGAPLCPPPVSITLWTTGSFTLLFSTLIMRPPIFARVEWIRRLSMWFFGYVLCEFASSRDFLHGIGYDGYLMHYTPGKMISHHFVTKRQVERQSFAIVRNPYSRLVSIYMYNRLWGGESFDHFVRSWYKKWKHYRQLKSTEERDVYCHVLPMFEYTHIDGVQVVPNVIRQEELSSLLAKPSTASGAKKESEEKRSTDAEVKERYKDLSPNVMAALQDMPHSNRRLTNKSKAWYDFYSQESMDLAMEMYWEDFQIFGYPLEISQRHDLKPKFSESNPPRTFVKMTFSETLHCQDEANESSRRFHEDSEASTSADSLPEEDDSTEHFVVNLDSSSETDSMPSPSSSGSSSHHRSIPDELDSAVQPNDDTRICVV